MKRLLVTGASGFLGWNVCAVAGNRWEVVGVVNRNRIDIPNAATVTCDITDAYALARMFSQVKPSGVIHCAAASKPNFCQEHPDFSRRVNVDAAVSIAELCARRGVPCAFTSSDLVFDGETPPYHESSPRGPVNVYGEQKVEAESGMLQAWPETAVCRMPLMFGRPSPVASSFLQPMVAALRQGKALSLFADEFRTPVSGHTAAAGLLLALENMEGVVHLGGRERISRYEFGRRLCGIMGADENLPAPSRQADAPMAAPRPRDVSLDSSRAYGLGYDPPELDSELRACLL
jgi:dTDP-4-dehydrorhamnose reductase